MRPLLVCQGYPFGGNHAHRLCSDCGALRPERIPACPDADLSMCWSVEEHGCERAVAA